MSRGKRAQWRGAWGSFLQLVLARQNVKKTQNFRKIFCSTGRRDRKSDDRKRREAPRNRSITGQTEVIPQSRVPRQANLRLSVMPHLRCWKGSLRAGPAVRAGEAISCRYRCRMANGMRLLRRFAPRNDPSCSRVTEGLQQHSDFS